MIICISLWLHNLSIIITIFTKNLYNDIQTELFFKIQLFYPLLFLFICLILCYYFSMFTFMNYILTPEFMVIISLAIFLYSFFKDSRRFRNAVFLLILLFALFVFSVQYSGISRIATIYSSIFVTTFMFLIFIIPFLLMVNSVQMLLKEGFHITSFLSIAFGIFILVGEFYFITSMIVAVNNYIDHSIHLIQDFPTLLKMGFGFSVLYISLVFVAFMFYSVFIQVLPRHVDFDYIVALGAGLIDGLTPTKLLANRLDKAIRVFNKSVSSCYIVVSGGQGADEKVSEAEAMHTYLIDKGIKNHQIILEDKSVNTFENMRNSFEIIKRRGGRMRIAVVTSNFHVYRALLLCQSLDIPAIGIGAPIALYFWPSAMIREYVALCKHYLKGYLLGWFIFVGFFLTVLSVFL